MPDEHVSDELAAECARELLDELEAEVIAKGVSIEQLELLKLGYAAQARLEDRQRADRTRLERRREYNARFDEARARERLWEEWQEVRRTVRRSQLSPRAKSNLINKFGAMYFTLPE